MLQKKLNELLELREMSGRELSRRTGLSVTYVHSLLSGENPNPSLNVLHKVAECLGVSASYLIEENTLGPEQILSHLSEEERKMVLSSDYLPWAKLSKKAIKEGVPVEFIDDLIDLIRKK